MIRMEIALIVKKNIMIPFRMEKAVNLKDVKVMKNMNIAVFELDKSDGKCLGFDGSKDVSSTSSSSSSSSSINKVGNVLLIFMSVWLI